jgi:hypothetical protein
MHFFVIVVCVNDDTRFSFVGLHNCCIFFFEFRGYGF